MNNALKLNFRRHLLFFFISSLICLLHPAAFAQKLAITMDDLPLNGELPPGVTEVENTRRVLGNSAEE